MEVSYGDVYLVFVTEILCRLYFRVLNNLEHYADTFTWQITHYNV